MENTVSPLEGFLSTQFTGLAFRSSPWGTCRIIFLYYSNLCWGGQTDDSEARWLSWCLSSPSARGFWNRGTSPQRLTACSSGFRAVLWRSSSHLKCPSSLPRARQQYLTVVLIYRASIEAVASLMAFLSTQGRKRGRSLGDGFPVLGLQWAIWRIYDWSSHWGGGCEETTSLLFQAEILDNWVLRCSRGNCRRVWD